MFPSNAHYSLRGFQLFTYNEPGFEQKSRYFTPLFLHLSTVELCSGNLNVENCVLRSSRSIAPDPQHIFFHRLKTILMEYTILFTSDAVVVSLFEAFTQSAVGSLFASCLFHILLLQTFYFSHGSLFSHVCQIIYFSMFIFVNLPFAHHLQMVETFHAFISRADQLCAKD